ncbi:MAG: DUF4097 family beta strand repeat-containing protein [Armatimonadota bacterium]|nr:DUF4097 family beta strand repeat-containing protein [Armatimonadota bacterium]MDR5697596.1 DUF4097 family beta strand repeat-containing protein [Armatimonadota bacterium]
MSDERLMVLKMLRDGKVSVEEAEALLEALGEEGLGAAPAGDSTEEGQRRAHQDQATEASGARRGPGPGRGWEGRVGPSWASLGREVAEAVREAVADIGPSVGEALRRLKEEIKGGGVVSASALVQGLFGLASAADEVGLSHPLGPGGRLRVRNPRGDVRIERSPDTQVHVQARRQAWFRDEQTARSLLDRIEVRLRPQDGDAVVEVGADPGVRFRVDLVVRVPDGAPVAVDVDSGDVRADGLAADLEVEIKSGDLEIGSHRGAIRGSVNSGDVQIRKAAACVLRVLSGDFGAEEVAGRVDLYVASGDARIGRVGGELVAQVLHGDLAAGHVVGHAQLKVMSGDAEVGECSGDVEALVYSGDLKLGVRGSRSTRAKAMSGDVEVRIVALPSDAEVALETVSGDVDLLIAPGVDARVSAQTRSGQVDWSIPAQIVQRSRAAVEGVVGSGQATVSIHALAGDISVREAT